MRDLTLSLETGEADVARGNAGWRATVATRIIHLKWYGTQQTQTSRDPQCPEQYPSDPCAADGEMEMKRLGTGSYLHGYQFTRNEPLEEALLP